MIKAYQTQKHTVSTVVYNTMTGIYEFTFSIKIIISLSAISSKGIKGLSGLPNAAG